MQIGFKLQEPCAHCLQRVARFKQGPCVCPAGFHRDLCCNASFFQRLDEFLRCDLHCRGEPPAWHRYGPMAALKHLLNQRMAREMLVPLTHGQWETTHYTHVILARDAQEASWRDGFDLTVQRVAVVQASPVGGTPRHFLQTFDLLDSVQCTHHVPRRVYCIKHDTEGNCKRHWRALPSQSFVVPFILIRGTDSPHVEVHAALSGANTSSAGPAPMLADGFQQYTLCALQPASLQTLAMRAINKHRVEYEHCHLPDPQGMAPLLWKACNPGAQAVPREVRALFERTGLTRHLPKNEN